MKRETRGAGDPILDAGQPPRGLAEPGGLALGTPHTRTEEKPWDTGALHSHHKFSLTGRGKRRENLSPQIILPQNPLRWITQREHQGLCNTGKHTWPSNTGAQRVGWTLSGPRPCWAQREQREAMASEWQGGVQQAGGQPAWAESSSAGPRCRAAAKKWLQGGMEAFRGPEGGPGTELLCRPQMPGLGHRPAEAGLCHSKPSCTVTARSRGAQGMAASPWLLTSSSSCALPRALLQLPQPPTPTPCFGASAPSRVAQSSQTLHSQKGLGSTEERMKERKTLFLLMRIA